jgi:hypothetical protein
MSEHFLFIPYLAVISWRMQISQIKGNCKNHQCHQHRYRTEHVLLKIFEIKTVSLFIPEQEDVTAGTYTKCHIEMGRMGWNPKARF